MRPIETRGRILLKRTIYALTIAIALSLSSLIAGSTPAAAYGADAVYQIGFSFNCDDPVACAVSPQNPFGPGGFWGWIELDSTTHPGTAGSAEIVVTGCDHDRTTVPHGGADHFTLEGTWWTAGGQLFVSTATLGGVFFVASATPGHTSLHPAPGIAIEIQVVRIPNR
jgi:hypothetical protein